LLELMVVMALVALAAGLTAPAVARWLASSQERALRQDLLEQINVYPLMAYREGHTLVIDEARLRQDVPQTAQLQLLGLDAPLRYAPDGTAAGGGLRLQWPDGRTERWTVLPLQGRVQVEAAR